MTLMDWLGCKTSIVIRVQKCKTALVAHSDARSTGDQGVAGSIPAGTGNILSRRLIMEYFLPSFAPSADSKRAVISFWHKNVHNHWLTA